MKCVIYIDKLDTGKEGVILKPNQAGGLAWRAARIASKPHFTDSRRFGWQSNSIIPHIASPFSKAAGAYVKLNSHPKKPAWLGLIIAHIVVC